MVIQNQVHYWTTRNFGESFSSAARAISIAAVVHRATSCRTAARNPRAIGRSANTHGAGQRRTPNILKLRPALIDAAGKSGPMASGRQALRLISSGYRAMFNLQDPEVSTPLVLQLSRP